MTTASYVIEHVPTADGATLALKRRPLVAAPPVLLIHGLAVNGDAWDLPPVDGPDFKYRSLASLLYDCGHDVWLLNLRGHGNAEMYSAPPAGQADWSVDHFVLFDVPAAVQHVANQTGQRPFVVASSMGAMSVAGWLQGATLSEGDVDGILRNDGRTAPYIVADEAFARERQSQIAGAVFVAFPAALRWPDSPIDDDGQVRWTDVLGGFTRGDSDTNYIFELFSRSELLRTLIELNGEVPLRWLRPDEKLIALRDRLPRPVGSLLEKTEENLLLVGANLIGTFNGATHHRAAVILRGKRHIMEDMKAGVLRQMGSSVRARAFVSDIGDPPHVYSDYYSHIASPTLVMLGGRDRIANTDTTRAVFFDRIAATDKTLRVFDEMGHGEFEAAPVATERVYPEIIQWIEARTALSSIPPTRDERN